MRPSARYRTRSAIAAARASWVTITIVCPRSATEWRSSSRISAPVFESRFPVGSSANTTSGCETSARAIATRCCWPPESSAGRCESRSPSPTDSTSSSKNAGSGFSPAIASGSRMFSSAFSIGSRLKNWKTKPMCSRRSLVRSESSSVVISLPAIVTDPEVGLSRPARMCIRVDLPEPDGPMTAVSFPARHLDRHTAERVDRRLALAVAPCHVARDDDRPVLALHGFSPRSRYLDHRLPAPKTAHGAENPTPVLGNDPDAAPGTVTLAGSAQPPLRLGEHVAEDADDLVHLGLGRDERRRDLHDGVAAVVGAADQPGLEECRREVAAQQRLALGVVERLPSSPCP